MAGGWFGAGRMSGQTDDVNIGFPSYCCQKRHKPYTAFHRLRTFGALAPVLRTIAYRHGLPPPLWGGERLPRRGRSLSTAGAEEEAGGRAGCDGRDVRSLRRPKVFEWGLQEFLRMWRQGRGEHPPPPRQPHPRWRYATGRRAGARAPKVRSPHGPLQWTPPYTVALAITATCLLTLLH